MIVHGGLVALMDQGFWRGLLITGESGAGKSDLALRLMQAGFHLVADDRALLWASNGQLFGRAPETIAGKIEARGIGILEGPFRPFCEVSLVCELTGDPVERMPEHETQTLLDIALPKVRMSPFEASSAAKLRRWLMALG